LWSCSPASGSELSPSCLPGKPICLFAAAIGEFGSDWLKQHQLVYPVNNSPLRGNRNKIKVVCLTREAGNEKAKKGGKNAGISFLDKLAAWGRRHIPDSYTVWRCCCCVCVCRFILCAHWTCPLIALWRGRTDTAGTFLSCLTSEPMECVGALSSLMLIIGGCSWELSPPRPPPLLWDTCMRTCKLPAFCLGVLWCLMPLLPRGSVPVSSLVRQGFSFSLVASSQLYLLSLKHGWYPLHYHFIWCWLCTLAHCTYFFFACTFFKSRIKINSESHATQEIVLFSSFVDLKKKIPLKDLRDALVVKRCKALTMNTTSPVCVWLETFHSFLHSCQVSNKGIKCFHFSMMRFCFFSCRQTTCTSLSLPLTVQAFTRCCEPYALHVNSPLYPQWLIKNATHYTWITCIT